MRHGARPTRAVWVCILLMAPWAAARAQQIPDNPQRRWEFFWQKRAFPFDRVPAGALQRARAGAEAVRSRLGAAPPPIAGTQWSPIGPQGIPISLGSIGRLSAIAVHPGNPSTIYVGGAQGGVWKSTDGGAGWAPMSDRECSLAMGALAIDPVNPQIVYAGTGEQHFSGDSYYGCGLLRSEDGGATWVRLGASVFQTSTGGARISRLVIDPRGAGTPAATRLLVASDFGLYRSPDGGATFTQVRPGVATDLVIDPSNPDVLYAAFRAGGIWKSVDGGATWVPRTVGFAGATQRINLAIAPSSPAVLYASAEAQTGGGLAGIWRTANGGDSWTQLSATGAACGTQCWYDQVIAVAPNDANTVYFGGVSLYRSTNGGAAFSNITGPMHVDQHALAFDPTDPLIVYAGNDGGIYRSVNGGTSWVSLNTNLALTQFYEGVSLHPWDPSVVMGGTQDNGTLAYAGSPTWSHVLGGDGGFTAIDHHDPAIRYAETQWTVNSGFSGPRRSDGSGFGLKVDGIGTGDRALFIPPLVMDPVDPRTLYFGTFRVYRTNDRAETWTAISPDLTAGGGSISAIAPAAGGDILYVGTGDGRVQTSDNGGESWVPRTLPLASPRFVQDIAVDSRDPLTAYAVVSGFLTPHVFRTTNGGTSFQDVTGNLPDAPVNAVVLDPTSRGVVLIGTDVGVFATADSGGTWTPIGDGLPTVAVFDLAYNAGTGVLIAATHGRGMFSLQLDRALTLALVPGDSRRDTATVGDTDVRTDSATAVMSGAGASAAGWTATHGGGTWLTLTTTGGTGSGRVRWSRNPAGLTFGPHVDTITITAPGAVDSPRWLIDSLFMRSGLALTFSPGSRRDSALVGSTTPLSDSATVSVVGPGADAASWTAAHGAGSWLTVTTAAGAPNTPVRWTRDPSGLAQGTYVDTIRILTATFDSARLVDSLLVVRPLAVTPSSRQASGLAASTASLPDEALVVLRGPGSAGATWNATHGGAAWLTLGTASGVGSGLLRWTRSAAALGVGAYVDTLVVATSRGDTARLIDAFVLSAPAIQAACAVNELFGIACLNETARRFLDLEGNRDGTYNLGDFLARLARTTGPAAEARRP